MKRKKGSGRKKKLSTDQREIVKTELELKPESNATQIKKSIIEKYNIDVTTETVRNIIKEHGYFCGKYLKKPLLRKHHKEKRLELCKYWQQEGMDFFENVLWSDETKICLFGNNTQDYLWKKEGDKVLE